jgi:general secretion pathway protein F
MPVYEYRALDARGKPLSGIMDAESAYAARQKLRSSKFFPVSITEIEDESIKKGLSVLSTSRLFARAKASEITMMTRQLSTLVGAGFPLLSAIDTMIAQSGSNAYKKLMAGLKDAIVEGKSFAEALSQFPGTFSSFYTNMVHAGETSGTLEIILERLADIMENQQALKNRIRTALTYPILMSLIGAAVLFLLLVYIVPGITSIFSEMNQVLPAPTRILIHTSEFFKSYWWTILILLVCTAAAYRTLKKNKKGRHLIDRIVLALPVIGDLKIKLAVSRISRTLASLLENGVSMMAALNIVKNIVENVIVSEAVVAAAELVEKGQGLGTAMEATGAFPFLSIQMIQIGEQSGELEAMLNKMASVFENDVESSVLRLTSILEPIMILAMGVVVGFIVISICLPIFEMNRLIV